MSVEYGFFQGRDRDRVYSDEHFAKYYAALVSSGVILSSALALQVVSATNMTLKINAGSAMLEGRWFRVVDSETITIPNANGVNSRYDRVVIRCDYSERKCSLVVISGVPASAPVMPNIVRDGTYFDISLCTVLVGVGVTKILQANITDTRSDNTVCGFVTGLINQIDTTALFAQFQSTWNDFVSKLGGDEHVTINVTDFEARADIAKVRQRVPISQMVKFI